jgi:hypothetical protein
LGKHYNTLLQRAWNKYGVEKFAFRPLAILEECEILPTEQRLLDEEHQGKTYNIAKDAIAIMKGRKHTVETIEGMRISRLGNKSRTGYPSHWSKDKKPPSLAKLIEVCKNPSAATREKMRLAKLAVTHCKNGHEYTEENTSWVVASGKHNPHRKCKTCKMYSRERQNEEKRQRKSLKNG